MYNAMMARVAEEMKVHFLNHWDNFPQKDRHLWSSRDSGHLSIDYGVPLLLRGIQDGLNRVRSCEDILSSTYNLASDTFVER